MQEDFKHRARFKSASSYQLCTHGYTEPSSSVSNKEEGEQWVEVGADVEAGISPH